MVKPPGTGLPQILPPALVDGGLPFALARAILLEFQPDQLLDLLWRVKTSDVAYLLEEPRCRDETYSLNGEQFLNIRHLLRFRFQHSMIFFNDVCFLLKSPPEATASPSSHRHRPPYRRSSVWPHQGPCPLHTDRMELALTPNLVDAIRVESKDNAGYSAVSSTSNARSAENLP